MAVKTTLKELHLYLHIPFCHRICPYCSFYKHTPGGTEMGRFVDALLTEAVYQRKRHSGPITTIYFGGGTPSMLSPTLLRRLFQGLRDLGIFDHAAEVTFEANPATFTPRTADLYADLGITRVSLGVQSFHPQHLATLGREHSARQAIASCQVIRDHPTLELNLDLIFSVPNQTLADWEDTVKVALAQQPDHLSAYNLTYEEDTAFFEKFQKGDYQSEDDTNAEMFRIAEKLLLAAGYEHYETSNYAQPGKRSQHNSGYWTGNPYLGLGPSAVSCIDRTRWQNVPDTAAYLHQVETVGHAASTSEILDDEAWRLERLALQLRTAEGLPREYLDPTIPLDPYLDYLELTPTHLRLRNDGPLLVDSLAEALA